MLDFFFNNNINFIRVYFSIISIRKVSFEFICIWLVIGLLLTYLSKLSLLLTGISVAESVKALDCSFDRAVCLGLSPAVILKKKIFNFFF